jgi:hypothetical protein
VKLGVVLLWPRVLLRPLLLHPVVFEDEAGDNRLLMNSFNRASAFVWRERCLLQSAWPTCCLCSWSIHCNWLPVRQLKRLIAIECKLKNYSSLLRARFLSVSS